MCRIWNYEGVEWDYEPTTFELLDGRGYTPDFKMAAPNSYVEVKGWESPEWEAKLAAFKQAHPDVKLRVINRPLYEDLEFKYADLLPFWEN